MIYYANNQTVQGLQILAVHFYILMQVELTNDQGIQIVTLEAASRESLFNAAHRLGANTFPGKSSRPIATLHLYTLDRESHYALCTGTTACNLREEVCRFDDRCLTRDADCHLRGIVRNH